ncbi:MAG: hypothetical protein ACRDNF_18530, partial [Streptosporangiaceae bacterium]
MIPRAVQAATATDMIALVVAAAAGVSPACPPAGPAPGRAAVRFLIAREEGTLAGVTGLARARAVPGVVEAGLTGRPGQQVRLAHGFT